MLGKLLMRLFAIEWSKRSARPDLVRKPNVGALRALLVDKAFVSLKINGTGRQTGVAMNVIMAVVSLPNTPPQPNAFNVQLDFQFRVKLALT